MLLCRLRRLRVEQVWLATRLQALEEEEAKTGDAANIDKGLSIAQKYPRDAGGWIN